MVLSIAVLALVTLQRLGELWIARRNTGRLLAAGAREYGAGHYPWMVALHSVWLGGLWLLAWDRPLVPLWFGLFLLMQAARLWVLATLGPRWTTRVIVLRSAPLVAAGPYRFLKHPNYALVVVEIAALPLAFGLPLYALIFSLLNAGILYVRIGVENRALAGE